MTPLDLARTAYIQAFQKHPLHRLKGKLPEREILSKIGDALSHSQEWKDYQNAWIAENGVKPFFVYEQRVSFNPHPQKRRKKRAPSLADFNYTERNQPHDLQFSL
jgi:hypothetical protein